MDLTRLAYLDFVLDWVKNNPDQHDQETWLTVVTPLGVFADEAERQANGWWRLPNAPLSLPECGTTGCVAGWAVQLSPQIKDGRWVLQWVVKDSDGDNDQAEVAYIDTTNDPDTSLHATTVSQAARLLFGLTWGEAEDMFDSQNTVDDLFTQRDQIVQRTQMMADAQ